MSEEENLISADLGPPPAPEAPAAANEDVFDPFADAGEQIGPPDPYPAMPEPFDDPGANGSRNGRSRNVDASGGVTLKIQPSSPSPQPKTPREDKPKSDPLAFLANAKEGKIKVRRLVSPEINSQGYYRTSSGDKIKVGIGECGFIPICGAQEILEYIKDNWGGGKYELTHVDQNDKKVSVGYLDLPQKPKPIEDVDDEENEFDDVPLLMQPGLNGLDTLPPVRGRGPRINGLPPRDPRLDDPRFDPRDRGGYDPRLDPRLDRLDDGHPRRAPSIVNTFRPSEAEIEAKKELESIKQRLEAERLAREAAEKERLKEQHAAELRLLSLKVEEAAKTASSGKSQEASVLKAELESLRREIETARREPKTDPMASFFQLMQLQQKEQALRWEQEREEQKRRDEALRLELDRKEEREREERRRLEQAERDRREQEENRRREEENRRREEERLRREEERQRREEELRRLELLENKKREEDLRRREEEWKRREEERRELMEKERREAEERRRLWEEERDRRDEERRRQEAREQAEREERRAERERQERREEERKREQAEFMRMMMDQNNKAATQVDPFAMVQKVMSLAKNIQEVGGGGGDDEEESTAVQIAKAALPAMAAIAAPFMARAEQAAQQPVIQPPQIPGPVVRPPQPAQVRPPVPPQAQPVVPQAQAQVPQTPTPQAPQPPKALPPKDKQVMVNQYAGMLKVVVDGFKANKDAPTVAAEVKAKAAELKAEHLLGILTSQSLDSLMSFINMAKASGLVGGMNAQTLDEFVAVLNGENGKPWVSQILSELK